MKKTSSRKKSSVISTIESFVKIYGFGFCVAIIILVVAYQFVEPAPPYKLTIASASSEGAYYKFAKNYQKYLAKEKINLTVLITSGSVENLELLKTGKADVAFIQGGIASRMNMPALKGLASLYLEPLLIFTRKDAGITDIREILGKRIAIGAEGSGTRAIALQILADNELNEGNVELHSFGGKEAAAQLRKGNIDGLFIVTQIGTPVVQGLFRDDEIEPMSLDRAESYTRLHNYLSHVVLPEGVVDMAKNIPPGDLHFVAPAATLVVHEDVHPALIDQLMQISTKIFRGGSLFGANSQFPSPDNLDFPLSKEADRYYRNGPSFLQRYLPFWAATLVDRLKVMLLPLVALILPLLKILPPTYRWRMRSRIYRWYDQLHQLDIDARRENSREVISQCLDDLDGIENEVWQVEVPLSYSQELYTLRQHIDLLRRQLRELQTSVDSSLP